MGKILSFLIFLAALAYVVLPAQPQPFRDPAPKELHFWGIYDLPEVYSPIIDEFKKTHPNIEVVYKQFPNSQEYQEVLMRQLPKGKGPDIFLFSDQNRTEVVPFINPTGIELAEAFPAYVREVLGTERLLFGVPLWVDSLVLYYNKQYYPNGIQSNWYDFAEQTRKLSIGGVAMGRLDNLRSGWDMLKTLFLQKGIQVSGKPANNLYDVLEFFTRFAYPIDPYFNWNENLNRDYPDAEIDSFAREKVAAIAGYSPLQQFLFTKIDQLKGQNLRSIAREEIGIAAFPQFTPEDPKYLGKYFFLGVSLHSSAPNEAWDFIRLLTTEENARYYQQVTGRTPGRVLASDSNDSELQKIQQLQLPNTSPFPISQPAQQRIEEVVGRGIKDKRLLREILEEAL